MNIKVSIIIPVYNVEKYLRKCLDSVINQTLKEIEIIIVNDCSPDNSEDIILEYKDSRIVYIKNKNNLGSGGSRNIGLSLAKGKYLSFIDPDDLLNELMYEKMFKLGIDNDLDLIECKIVKINEMQFFNKIDYKITNKFKIFQGEKLNYKIEHGFTHSIWSKLYKTDILKDNTLLFPNNNITDDATFNYKFFTKVKKIAYLYDDLYYYLQRDGGLTKKKLQQDSINAVINNLKEIKEFLDKNNVNIEDNYRELIAKFYLSLFDRVLNYNDDPYNGIEKIKDNFISIISYDELKYNLNKYYPFYIIQLNKAIKNKQNKKRIYILLELNFKDRIFLYLRSSIRILRFIKDRGLNWVVYSIKQRWN